MKRQSRAFTLIEALVIVSIISLLMTILLPALAAARDHTRLSKSKANLRNLATAHATYVSEWNGRQFTLCKDNLSHYGNDESDAYTNYMQMKGHEHPPILLGWGAEGALWGYWMSNPGNRGMCQPIIFPGGPSNLVGFGAFRIPNARQFSQYVSGRFYDPVFYAPKDEMVMACVDKCRDDPGEFCPAAGCECYWSSYCLSPAAMFSPDVMANPNQGGWKNPWIGSGSFRSPPMSRALYPDLKTHMLEHHWLQDSRQECNSAFQGGAYDGCQPYYFNHGWQSVPMALFYDGHIEGLGVAEAMDADDSHYAQVGWGLWSRDTPFGSGGYFHDLAYDWSNTSFHILTTDGIRGRDKFGD